MFKCHNVCLVLYQMDMREEDQQCIVYRFQYIQTYHTIQYNTHVYINIKLSCTCVVNIYSGIFIETRSPHICLKVFFLILSIKMLLNMYLWF